MAVYKPFIWQFTNSLYGSLQTPYIFIWQFTNSLYGCLQTPLYGCLPNSFIYAASEVINSPKYSSQPSNYTAHNNPKSRISRLYWLFTNSLYGSLQTLYMAVYKPFIYAVQRSLILLNIHIYIFGNNIATQQLHSS